MMPRIYLDTAPVIYAVEGVAAYSSTIQERFAHSDSNLVVSDLTRLECRVKPIHDRDISLLNDYDYFFADASVEVIALTREIMDQAAEIRAAYGYRTPDAIHLAAAIVTNCDVFLTNDHDLINFTEISVELIR